MRNSKRNTFGVTEGAELVTIDYQSWGGGGGDLSVDIPDLPNESDMTNTPFPGNYL